MREAGSGRWEVGKQEAGSGKREAGNRKWQREAGSGEMNWLIASDFGSDFLLAGAGKFVFRADSWVRALSVFGRDVRIPGEPISPELFFLAKFLKLRSWLLDIFRRNRIIECVGVPKWPKEVNLPKTRKAWGNGNPKKRMIRSAFSGRNFDEKPAKIHWFPIRFLIYPPR